MFDNGTHKTEYWLMINLQTCSLTIEVTQYRVDTKSYYNLTKDFYSSFTVFEWGKIGILLQFL